MNAVTDTDSTAPEPAKGWSVSSWMGFAVICLLLATAIVAAGFLIHNNRQAAEAEADDSGQSERVVAVDTLTVEPVDAYSETLVYTGVVKARRSSDLSFLRAGRVARVLVKPGETVGEGAVLAELDRAALEAEQAGLRERIAQLPAGSAPEDAADNEARLRAAVQELARELAQLREQVERLQPTERTPPSSLEARLENAARRIAMLEAALRRDASVARSTAQAEVQSRLGQIEVELDESSLTAPFAGIVAQQYVHEGAVVSPGRPIVRLVERDAWEAWVGIPVDHADQLTVGETLEASIGGESITATVAARLPDLDPSTRTRTVILTLDSGAPAEVLPGQSVRVELQREQALPGFWLPLTALTRDANGLWTALAVETDDTGQQVLSRRLLEIVHAEAGRALVRGAIDAGDRVVATGTQRVVAGQRVEAQQ